MKDTVDNFFDHGLGLLISFILTFISWFPSLAFTSNISLSFAPARLLAQAWRPNKEMPNTPILFCWKITSPFSSPSSHAFSWNVSQKHILATNTPRITENTSSVQSSFTGQEATKKIQNDPDSTMDKKFRGKKKNPRDASSSKSRNLVFNHTGQEIQGFLALGIYSNKGCKIK